MAHFNISPSNLINPLQEYLEKVDLRTEFIPLTIPFKKLYTKNLDYLGAVGEEMEVDINPFIEIDLIFTYNVLHLQPTDHYLFFDPDYHFNRYRLKTLRNSYYQEIPFFDVQKWRTYSRSKEKEAFKGGLIKEIWAPALSEKLLGEADEPGYFGGNGSTGWKMLAIADFCLDLHVKDQQFNFLRLSAYDSFMTNGKIELLGNSLKVRKEESPIQKMIARKLHYIIPSIDDEINDK